MVNKKGGKKHKRGKNQDTSSKTIRYKEEGQEYAQIKSCNGNCRFTVMCFDGVERKAVMCGAMRKRKFVSANDIVLVSVRDFQDEVCDIIDSYDETQARKMKSNGLFPDIIKLQEENEFNHTEDLGIDFEMPEYDEDNVPEEDNVQEEEEVEEVDTSINLDDI